MEMSPHQGQGTWSVQSKGRIREPQRCGAGGTSEPHSKSQVLTQLHDLQRRGLGYKEVGGIYSRLPMQQGLG